MSVYFIDLDGMHHNVQRHRQTRILAYNQEAVVHTAHFAIPMSPHSIDAVNLKDPRFGFFEQIEALLHRHDIHQGRVDIALGRKEQHAGLTVNEYENLLMQKDLVEVLKGPLQYMARKGRSFLSDPATMRSKAKHYTTYDLVHIINELMNVLQVDQPVIERIVSRVLSASMVRFLGMQRTMSWLVSNSGANGPGMLVQGTYQSPILIQWQKAPQRQRTLDITVMRFQ